MKWLCMLCALQVSMAQAQSEFKPLRYDEDYSYLPKDSIASPAPKAKFISLSKTKVTYLSLGGEIRYQYFKFRNEDWGKVPDDRQGFVLSRYLTHADLNGGRHFRIFLQFQSSIAAGKRSTSAVDENILDLHQLFIDYKVSGEYHLTCRLGRQEILLGSQRLVSVRDRPNNRQSFDGIRIIYKRQPVSISALYVNYVTAKKGLFDDAVHREPALWGIYAVFKNCRFVKNIDLYYLGLYRQNATFDDGSGRELRHTAGSRIWNEGSIFSYDIETAYQSGALGNKTIRAWTLSVHVSRKFKAHPLNPQIGIKSEFISGDSKKGDNRLQTFNALYPKGAYFGLAAIIGPSNLADIHPYLSLNLTQELMFSADYDVFWRASRNDGIYGPNTSLHYSGSGTRERYIGGQLGCSFDFRPDGNFHFALEGTWFKPGAFLQATGATKDLLLATLSATYKF